jgi:general secretion pathway protein H
VGSLIPVRRHRAPARPRPVASSGFTLLEILVVLVILGVTAGLVVVNLGGDERGTTEREARRLAGALEHAAAAAQWRSETLGVSADGDGYRFWRRTADDRWLPLSGDDALASRRLPNGLRVVPLAYAGAPVPPDAIFPFRPSGRNEPYTLALSSPAWNSFISADPLNRVGATPATPASH